GVNGIMIPVSKLLLGIGRLSRAGDVLNLVAAAGHERAYALGPERRDDARGTASPVEARMYRLLHIQRVEELQQIMRERGLLPRPHRVGRQEARAAVASQIGSDGAKACTVEDGNDFVEAARVVGKPVQQHHRKRVCRSTLLVRDLETGSAKTLHQAASSVMKRLF